MIDRGRRSIPCIVFSVWRVCTFITTGLSISFVLYFNDLPGLYHAGEIFSNSHSAVSMINIIDSAKSGYVSGDPIWHNMISCQYMFTDKHYSVISTVFNDIQ